MKKFILFLAIIYLFPFVSSYSQLKVLSNGSIQGGQTNGVLRLETSYGYVNIGANNYYHTHFYTYATQGCWFDKELMTGNGQISSYQSDLTLRVNDYQKFVIRLSNGNCGIGNNFYPDAAYKLDVDGTVAADLYITNSDIRLKKDLEEVSDTKVNSLYSLQAWTYYLNNQTDSKLLLDKSDTDTIVTDITDPIDTTIHIGFVAQEVQVLFPELVRERENGYLTIDYVSLIPIMVEAIKEQKAKIEALEQIIKPKPEHKDAEKKNNSSEIGASLTQNQPNPFTENTIIEFFLPSTVQNASMYIYDMQGMQIRCIKVSERENGKVIINGYELQPGMYFYSLIADGKIIGTKNMILTD